MGVIQGLDTIPREIQNDRVLKKIFEDFLPGWFGAGEYNFRPGATTQMASAQLGVLMQNGSHPWINNQIRALLEGDEFKNLLPAQKTQRLAALVNFMGEASGPEALASNGGKTGGYIAFASRSDPNLIAKLNYQPTTAQMEALTRQGLSWSNILGSQAGQEALAINPKVVAGVLEFDGHLNNGGFFSRAADKIGTWKKYTGFFAPSTQYSAAWTAQNKITVVRDAKGIADGSILKDGVAVRRAEASALLATRTLTAGAVPISSFAKASSKLLARLAKPLAVAVLITLAPAANAAQLDPNYTPVAKNPANKAFIEELFGAATGGLAGLVAGSVAGTATFGLAAIPVGIAAAYVGDLAGRQIGTFFYDNFTESANELAEWIAPLLSPVGEGLIAIGEVIEDVAGMIFGAVTDAFEYVEDLVSGSEGLFGLNGPLFGFGAPLHAVVDFSQNKGFLTHDGRWAYDGFDNVLYGTEGDDVLVHDEGTGKAFGGKGDDVLLGLFPRFAPAGSPLIDGSPAPAAEQDTALLLDGGVGNDWVIAVGGERAITVGGLGRDWLYNTSSDGEIWGDVANSYRKPGSGSWERYYVETDAQGGAVEKVVADDVTNRDVFWWSSGTTIMDAQKSDVLKFFGIPLTGGTDDGGLILSALGFGAVGAVAGAVQANRSAVDTIYVDHIMPFLTYKFEAQRDGGYDLLVGNVVSDFLAAFDAVTAGGAGADFDRELKKHRGVQVVKNFVPKGADGAFAWSYGGFLQGSLNNTGPLNLVFKKSNPIFDILARLPDTLITSAASGGGPLADLAFSAAAVGLRYAKAVDWLALGDPLVLDLDGDGIETSSADAGVWFNIDGGVFAKRTGWVDGDDGLLAVDANGNGRIDDISELFGSRFAGGFAELAGYDSNGDGKVTSADAGFASLRVWQDRDQDGESDGPSTGSGRSELYSLAELGIVELSLATTDLGSAETAEGTRLLSAGSFRRADGSTGVAYEAIFGADDSATRYARESGRASWQSPDQGSGQADIDMRGFGSVTDLGIAMANDPGFAALVGSRAAAMTAPKLKTLVAQVGDVLGAWGATLETTRELYAVRVSSDGGTLLESKLWDGAALGPSTGSGVWRLEQGWSPHDRAVALTSRTESPYLVRVQNGRAVVLDYGVELGNGTWTLANAGGSFATRADVLASAHTAGTEWRAESFGFNPYANLPVESIGVRFLNGKAIDYTVEVTLRHAQGPSETFHVWARNLDRALELQWKTGDARDFNLRNYEVDFANLDEVGSADDSRYRVEKLTPAQLHFATSLGGVDFQPQMLSATIDAGGHIAYTVNASGSPSLSGSGYVSGIKGMIDLLDPVMATWVQVSRRMAVLDLDGDGVNLIHYRRSNATFDMNGDGAADDTGWIDADDAFLVIDRDLDGQITDASELTLLAEDPKARNSLSALRVFDTNNDGQVDQDDTRFAELKLWIDRNSNGTTDEGELVSLEGAGIASLSLASQGRSASVKLGDNLLAATATFTRANGSMGTMGSVALSYAAAPAPLAADETSSRTLNAVETSAAQMTAAMVSFGVGSMGEWNSDHMLPDHRAWLAASTQSLAA